MQAHVTDWARRHPDAALASTETVRTLHADARGHGEWTVVLSLGLVLEAAYAQTGRWDAWRTVAEVSLEAARALGDAAAEAMALHQLGTHALCVGDTAASVELLRAALDLRTRLGDAAGAAATQHNLSLLVADRFRRVTTSRTRRVRNAPGGSRSSRRSQCRRRSSRSSRRSRRR